MIYHWLIKIWMWILRGGLDEGILLLKIEFFFWVFCEYLGFIQ